MERLSEAGRLYLENYHALQRARDDMDRFLNRVAEHLVVYIEGNIAESCSGDNGLVKCRVYANQTHVGKIHVYLRVVTEREPFVERKSYLEMDYRDIRYASDLARTDEVCIRVAATKVDQRQLKRWENELQQAMSWIEERHGIALAIGEGQNTLFRAETTFDLDNAAASAERIGEILLECADAIQGFMMDLCNRIENIPEA